MPDISIVRCKDYTEPEVRRAMAELLGQIDGLKAVKSGMKVVIKANLVSFLRPEKAATTHPALLCELVRLLKERGADVIIGDSPGGLYTRAFLDRIYSATEMKLAELAGAVLNRNFDVSAADFPEAAVLKNFEYTSYLDDADMIINFSKLKTHGMMGLTAAVKNLFGAIPGTCKTEFHYRFPDTADFANMLVDLNEYFRPCLSIVDAVIGMEGNGPTTGSPRFIGALLASPDPYKLDLACAHIIGLSKDEVPTLTAAYCRGLAPADVHELDLDCDIDSFQVMDFKKQPVQKNVSFYSGKSLANKILKPLMNSAFSPRPALGRVKCAACGKCAEICPAKAVAVKKGKAIIDRQKCIRCFCCQEFCPIGAMVSKRTLIARLIVSEKRRRT